MRDEYIQTKFIKLISKWLHFYSNLSGAFFLILHNTVHTSINNIVLKHLSAQNVT